ncbi:hypothetical protein GCM10023259_042130 [Thermocatellispora tengchongensis]
MLGVVAPAAADATLMDATLMDHAADEIGPRHPLESPLLGPTHTGTRHTVRPATDISRQRNGVT